MYYKVTTATLNSNALAQINYDVWYCMSVLCVIQLEHLKLQAMVITLMCSKCDGSCRA